jgi:predicted DNA-binding protein (MmcQ/YjbR family)
MAIDWVRNYCLSLPHTTESVQWGDDLVFKVAGKMYAVAALEPGERWLTFKCSAEDFTELIERPGITPAPYLARAQWVSLEAPDAMPRAEVHARLRKAYDLIVAKLPKKTRVAIAQ